MLCDMEGFHLKVRFFSMAACRMHRLCTYAMTSIVEVENTSNGFLDHQCKGLLLLASITHSKCSIKCLSVVSWKSELRKMKLESCTLLHMVLMGLS
ncbi:hypothetical protein L1987_23540 [Smallanthus sonchifolius]|uniref:Uncharacterized protein n=1 Tax=Smallanthus sonchifolius TaxID=185202 RepID=A0ACB9IH81_9ASTR|nr:hypothetical protein L1987_23540 [Smallanthus sonchifolius]